MIKKARSLLGDQALDLHLLGSGRQDLNLRPLGYEPSYEWLHCRCKVVPANGGACSTDRGQADWMTVRARLSAGQRAPSGWSRNRPLAAPARGGQDLFLTAGTGGGA